MKDKPTSLIVDDEARNIELQKAYLEPYNYKILMASSYLQGPAGEHIPLSGRITAVADVFDALISKRPYKPPLSYRESLTIIKNERGTHFDPGVVDAFISTKQEILSIAEQYKDSA